MTKTFALLLDSYRELNAKRLFWIVLMISAIVVGACAIVGLKNGALTLLWWETPLRWDVLTMIKPAMLYKVMFSYLGIGFWLAWIGNVLALVSTAGIFPDFMAGGSIDLYLSKPISRLRLFLIKYIGGLLFVTLQVSIFAFCSFLLLGMRGHTWEPSVFLAIPLVMLVFSYLFSICVILGILTRSTIASLLLTMLIWSILWGVQFFENKLMRGTIMMHVHDAALVHQIDQAKIDLAKFPPSTGPTTMVTTKSGPPVKRHDFGFFSHHDNREETEARLDQLESERQEVDKYKGALQTAATVAYVLVTPLPKTKATTDLMDRVLFTKADIPSGDTDDNESQDISAGPPNRGEHRAEMREAKKQIDIEEGKRSATWVIGTSLGFELVIVSVAAWLFCRRDY